MELSSEQAMLMAAETLHLHCTYDSMYNYDDYPKLRCDFTFIGIVKGKGKRKAEHLYSALNGIQTTLKRSDMDHTVLLAINTIPAHTS